METTDIAGPRLRAARIVGLLYLLTMAISVFGFYARSQVVVRGDIARTVQNLVEFQTVYRLGLVAEILTAVLVMVLVVALHIVLEPVNRYASMAAAALRIAENAILAMIPLGSLAALSLITATGGRDALTEQTSLLAFALMRIHFSGFNLGFLLLGIGSAVFSYLWYKSRLIPRLIAAWGVFASIVLAAATAAMIVLPGLSSVLGLAYMAPMGIYEVGLGLWLLFVGIKSGDRNAR